MDDIIAIDEGQFIEDLAQFCKKYRDKKIIISALSGDFNCDMFQPIIDVLPMSDKIIHLQAICLCGNKAAFTGALDNFDRITIGGSDKFQALCGDCFCYL